MNVFIGALLLQTLRYKARVTGALLIALYNRVTSTRCAALSGDRRGELGALRRPLGAAGEGGCCAGDTRQIYPPNIPATIGNAWRRVSARPPGLPVFYPIPASPLAGIWRVSGYPQGGTPWRWRFWLCSRDLQLSPPSQPPYQKTPASQSWTGSRTRPCAVPWHLGTCPW